MTAKAKKTGKPEKAQLAMTDAQATALDALSQLDVAGLVQRIESDSKDGGMTTGQRKSAHLLLSYYAPKAKQNQHDTDTALKLTSAQILDMLNAIRQIRSDSGSNTAPVPSKPDKASIISHLPTRSANQPPSLPDSDSSAGVTSRMSRLSNTPIENTNIENTPIENADSENSDGTKPLPNKPLL